MKKIQKIIDSCYDCEFRHVFARATGGQAKAHLCVPPNWLDETEVNTEPFLLDLCENGSNALPIPDNCPLETYKAPTT